MELAENNFLLLVKIFGKKSFVYQQDNRMQLNFKNTKLFSKIKMNP